MGVLQPADAFHARLVDAGHVLRGRAAVQVVDGRRVPGQVPPAEQETIPES
jgi:hypothetical protein